MIQLYLRLEQQHSASQLFLQDPQNAKSILARSAAASAGGRRKDFAGKQVQPFLAGMREALVSALNKVLEVDSEEVRLPLCWPEPYTNLTDDVGC